MVHAKFLEAYIHFALIYTTDHSFTVIPIKYINKYGKPTTSFKLATGTKPSVSHSRVLFCPCVVRKSTASVDKKSLNMRHQAQKRFRSIFVGIAQHQKVCLVYVSSTRKIISLWDVIFDESFVQCVSIYVTTLFRGNGYAYGCEIYTLFFIFKGTN